jgi:hypothetical protein
MASSATAAGLHVSRGEIEVQASDGERRRFLPGACLLMEDTLGKGHATRNVGSGAVLMAVAQLRE